jgi:hypothetical protein
MIINLFENLKNNQSKICFVKIIRVYLYLKFKERNIFTLV